MIQSFPKKRVSIDMVQWTGTPESVKEIQEWVKPDEGLGVGAEGFYPVEQLSGRSEHAQLWVNHQKNWSPLPLGHWVAKELDGTGFYPISPEGLIGGYDLPPRRVQPSVDGIRGHRVYTEAEAEAARLAVLATPLLTPEQVESLGLIDKPAPLDYQPMPELGTA